MREAAKIFNYGSLVLHTFLQYLNAFSIQKVSTEISKTCDIFMSKLPFETDKPFSHFKMVCLSTFNFSESASWEGALFFRIFFRLLPNIYWSPFLFYTQL